MNFRFSFFTNVVLDSGDIRHGKNVTDRFFFENVNDMIARADEQMVRFFYPQCFAVGCVDCERLERLSLLQLPNFVRDHQSRVIFSTVTDKIDNGP